MANKNGGFVGINGAKLQILDNTTKPVTGTKGIGDASTGIYTVTGANGDLGVASANISGLAGAITPIFGNNQKTDVSIGKPNPSVALVINALDFETKMKLSGYVSDNKGGWTATGTPSKVAMLLQTNLLDGSAVYFGFSLGIINAGDIALATDNANETRITDSFTYSPLESDLMPVGYKIYKSSDPQFNEANMLAEVFQAGTPAGK